MGVRASLAAWLAPAALLAACAPAEIPRPPTVSLRMQGTPVEATVVIDEQTMGSLDLVALKGVALRPGVHHVTVRADGFLPWDREVKAELGRGPIRLDVAMTPIPD